MGNSPSICKKHYAALLPEAIYLSVDFEDWQQEKKQHGAVDKQDEGTLAYDTGINSNSMCSHLQSKL